MSTSSYDMVASMTNTIETLHQYLLAELKIFHNKLVEQDNRIILIDANIDNINRTIKSITKTSQEIISTLNNLNSIYSNYNTDIELVRDKIHYEAHRITGIQDGLTELHDKVHEYRQESVSQNIDSSKITSDIKSIEKRITEIEWTIDKGYKNIKMTIDDITKRIDKMERARDTHETHRKSRRKMCVVQ
jgi:chromosome segregation ATPase